MCTGCVRDKCRRYKCVLDVHMTMYKCVMDVKRICTRYYWMY